MPLLTWSPASSGAWSVIGVATVSPLMIGWMVVCLSAKTKNSNDHSHGHLGLWHGHTAHRDHHRGHGGECGSATQGTEVRRAQDRRTRGDSPQGWDAASAGGTAGPGSLDVDSACGSGVWAVHPVRGRHASPRLPAGLAS